MSETAIFASCPRCGEVELRSADVHLVVAPSAPARSFYGFDCPGCSERVIKAADDRIVRLLVSGGVHVWPLDLPPEGAERLPAPPLSLDDLIDLHQALERDDFLDRITETLA